MESENKKKLFSSIQLLVIESHNDVNWYEIFSNSKININEQEVNIKIEQAEWNDIS